MTRGVELEKTISFLESFIEDPSKGLPEDVFLFISRITPLINVDLLIKNDDARTLLTWRDDGYCRPGWHVPGGIIRYKETAIDRIRAVAQAELGAGVTFKADPLAINEIILPTLRNRAHSISILYQCALVGPPDDNLRYEKGTPRRGEWAWHDKCPDDIIPVHEIYRKFM